MNGLFVFLFFFFNFTSFVFHHARLAELNALGLGTYKGSGLHFVFFSPGDLHVFGA